MNALTGASAHDRGSGGGAVGYAAAVVGVLSSLVIIGWSARLTLIFLDEIGGWCGTAMAAAHAQLCFAVPIFLVVPYACDCICSWCGFGRLAARWAFILAASTWLGYCTGEFLLLLS